MPLIIVPTPIGNLEDITLRALRVLREAEVIACEDTRRAGRLLTHYEIKKPLISYHEHNENQRASQLAERARIETVALISDAGMPLVSDPGFPLVRECVAAGIPVEALPGPSVAMTALVLSGLPADTVVFAGFMPRRGRERQSLLDRIGHDEATFILFESPKRLAATLGELPAGARVAVCRELTKLHEEVFRGAVEEAAERFSGEVKGEIALVVRGGAEGQTLGMEQAVKLAQSYIEAGESPSRAAARAAKAAGRQRREIYERLTNSRE